jgi:hypothetical protein
MSLRPIIALLVALLTIPTRALDVDSGMDAIGLAHALTSQQLSGVLASVSQSENRGQAPGGQQSTTASSKPSMHGWVRLRGIDLNRVLETREALLKLRARGIKTCVFLRRSVKDWKVTYLPSDLTEAYNYGRKLDATYGDLVDAWEVDNEPDLGFVPESSERYTAFLKVTYLGIKAGSLHYPQDTLSAVGQAKAEGLSQGPLVIMGSLGLPPGPWLERFAANDGFAYTDGFNYHYYGYADDFTGVYRQHEAAALELSTLNSQHSTAVIKSLPVFMTEIGYGMLGKNERDTKEGRLRQWRWFKSVGEQIATLRPEAPMAFYLRPYLEYDTSEYGLSVPARQVTEKAETRKLKAEGWIAGGVEYTAEDFGASKAEQWMRDIGQKLGGNEMTPALVQWLAGRRSAKAATGSRSWSVSTNAPSPVVIDFLPGEGLSHIKRYNGSFVTGREPPVHKNPETGDLKPEGTPPKPKIPDQKPETPIPRSEEFILQIRTQNGNLYEVYPTRQAGSDWQRFIEPGNNFTMAFYGRASLPWRFNDNKPASLVVVMYPKQLPATYEFRRPQLLKLGASEQTQVSALSASVSQSENRGQTPGWQQPSTASSQLSTNYRYGTGTVVLYNFLDKPVTGRLVLPPEVERVAPNALSEPAALTLAPGERREIPVIIKVPWDRFTRISVPITFAPEVSSMPVARYLTALIPDIAGLPATLLANLLAPGMERVAVSAVASGEGRAPNELSNRSFIANRPRASEEAPMMEQSGWLAQAGAQVERSPEGFTIKVSSIPPGKPQRIEVEIPWPDGLAFGEEEFLSVEFRLKP